MIFTIGFFFLFTTVFFCTGAIFLSACKINFNSFTMSASILSGIALMALIGQWCAYFSLKIHIFFLILSIVILFLFVMVIFRKQVPYLRETFKLLKKSKSESLPELFLPAIIAIIFMTLYQGRWLSGEIAYRTGPDSFGWADTIIFFRDNLSLAQLKELILRSLGDTPLFSAINHVHSPGTTAISQIPSFTRQINAEFLFGANRTGIPNVLGNFAQFFPKELTLSLIVAFLMTCVFTMAQLSFIYFRQGKNSYWLSAWGCIAVTLNCNLMFQSLEGGVGQLYSTPFVILAIVLILQVHPDRKLLPFALGLIFVISLSSYFDILFTALPILGGLLLFCIFVKKEYGVFTFLKSGWMWALLLISFIPFAPSFMRIAISPFIHPTAGGWDIGRQPLPINTFGIISNLPSGGERVTEGRTSSVLIVECLLSIGIFLYLILQRKGKLLFLAAELIFVYFYLYYSVYHLQEPFNNYRLWKYAAVASTIFPFILLHAKIQNGAKDRQVQKSSPSKKIDLPNISRFTHWLAKKDSTIVHLILLAITVSSLNWMLDWQYTKSLTLNPSEQKFISENANKYDFVVDGSIYATMVTIYGDIHYVSPHRGSVRFKTQFSQPIRPILFLANKNCRDSSCIPALDNLYPRKLEQLKFTVYPNFVAVTTKFVD